MKVKYDLPPLDKYGIDRLLEIKFYLFMKQLFSEYGSNNSGILNLTEVLCRLFVVRVTPINLAISQLSNPVYEPTKTELALASKYLNITVRKFQKLTGMSNPTYYEKLKECEEFNFKILIPKLELAQRIEIERFMKKAKEMFKDISEVLQYD